MPKQRRLRGAQIDDWLDLQLPMSDALHSNRHTNRKGNSKNSSFNSSFSTSEEQNSKLNNSNWMEREEKIESRHRHHTHKHRSIDAVTLRRVFMLQNFQFVLWPDLLSTKNSHGLLEGQRKLLECLECSDRLIPWEAVHSVVMRAPPESFECPICLQYPIAPRITECGHLFCLPCLLQYIAYQKENKKPRSCPVCQSTVVCFALRPCILQPTLTLNVGQEACFDLYKREKNSIVLRRYDDPYWRELAKREVSNERESETCVQHDNSKAEINNEIVSSLELKRENLITERASTAKMCINEEEEGNVITHSNNYIDNNTTPSLPQLALPELGSTFALQARYVTLTPKHAVNQRHLDATGVTERMQELEHLPRPLTKYDAEVLCAMEQAWDEVSKEPRGIAHTLLRNSPLIAPRHALHNSNNNKLYELYVEGVNGQEFYLHMLTVKMLRYDAHIRQTTMPSRVCGKVEEIVTFYQDEETRQKFKVFSHIPLHGIIRLCILDLRKVVLPETIKHFTKSLEERANYRLQRENYNEMLPTEDVEWKRYIEKYKVPSDTSPNIVPSIDLSLETESMSNFLLPSVSSVYSDHGLPPNTLDTRQRATKKRTELPLSHANISAEIDETSTSANNEQQKLGAQNDNCWSTGKAIRLLSRSTHSQN